MHNGPQPQKFIMGTQAFTPSGHTSKGILDAVLTRAVCGAKRFYDSQSLKACFKYLTQGPRTA